MPTINATRHQGGIVCISLSGFEWKTHVFQAECYYKTLHIVQNPFSVHVSHLLLMLRHLSDLFSSFSP